MNKLEPIRANQITGTTSDFKMGVIISKYSLCSTKPVISLLNIYCKSQVIVLTDFYGESSNPRTFVGRGDRNFHNLRWKSLSESSPLSLLQCQPPIPEPPSRDYPYEKDLTLQGVDKPVIAINYLTFFKEIYISSDKQKRCQSISILAVYIQLSLR